MLDFLNKQVLILPINNCVFSAGYKNKAYLNQQGYSHYGVDLFSDDGTLTVYACGNGKVVACGFDGIGSNARLGNCIVIIYENVYIPHNIYDDKGKLRIKAGSVINLAQRSFHFSKVLCKVGDVVTKDTVIGHYGNTGSTTVNGKPMGYHLHTEFDTDIDYPQYAVGISRSGNIIKKGTVDSTVNPSLLWTLDKNQKIWGKYAGWYSNEDVDLAFYRDFEDIVNPVVPETPSKPESPIVDHTECQKTISELETEITELVYTIQDKNSVIDTLENKVDLVKNEVELISKILL